MCKRCVIIKVLFSLLMSYKYSNHHSHFVFNLYGALTRHLLCVRETHMKCADDGSADGWSGNLNN